jgi:hypothetical protein
MAEAEVPPARHEPQDVSFHALGIGFIATLVTLLLCVLLAIWLFPQILQDRRLTSPLPSYPSPQLQADPPADMRAFLHREADQLNSGGWIDRNAGIAHIPIDEAMKLLAARGIPDWPTATPSPTPAPEKQP